jgi:hypothetical protein
MVDKPRTRKGWREFWDICRCVTWIENQDIRIEELFTNEEREIRDRARAFCEKEAI